MKMKTKSVKSAWFTNLGKNRHKPIKIIKKYNPLKYPSFDNYDPRVRNVDKLKDIPDYDDFLAVPVTFLKYHNPDQFEIKTLGTGNSWANFTQDLKDLNFNPSIKYGGGLGTGIINGKAKYARIIIKRRKK